MADFSLRIDRRMVFGWMLLWAMWVGGCALAVEAKLAVQGSWRRQSLTVTGRLVAIQQQLRPIPQSYGGARRCGRRQKRQCL